MSPAELPETIRLEDDQTSGVQLLTINRPDRMNAIGPVESRGLFEAMKRFRDDDSARVLVITGAGPNAFCAGADLNSVAAMYQDDPPVEPLFDVSQGLTNHPIPAEGNIGPTRWADMHKPVIAAVNGAAYAGGLEWACFAHLRVADRHASFGVTCRRWNVGLGDGGTQRLPRLVGLGPALELIITGRVIGAEEAASIGLVNRIVPSGTCVEEALVWAREIAALPQPALRTDLEAAVRGFGRPLPDGLELEAECFNRLMNEPELKLGAERFVERDHPDRQAGSQPLHLPAKAYAFAEKAHRETPGKFGGDAPFIGHPAAVADEVAKYGDEVTVAVAYLHDTIEKTSVTADELDRAFGSEIRDLVVDLSQDPSITDDGVRRLDHRRRVIESGGKARLVYAADRLDGIRYSSELIDGNAYNSEVPVQQRADSWRDDIVRLDETGLPHGLLSELELAIDDLDSRLS
ncbi:MAG: enoyl-CoA hydratase/isomerase family protein [Solirubrobacterales bacterium]|nr:enoyl-CoA hydratase/isomerase family protein [Solirubrobacterales bacterium]